MKMAEFSMLACPVTCYFHRVEGQTVSCIRTGCRRPLQLKFFHVRELQEQGGKTGDIKATEKGHGEQGSLLPPACTLNVPVGTPLRAVTGGTPPQFCCALVLCEVQNRTEKVQGHWRMDLGGLPPPHPSGSPWYGKLETRSRGSSAVVEEEG